MTGLTATFHSYGRKATCEPDPAYPDGMVVDVASEGQSACSVELTYPAPEVGVWLLECSICGLSAVITAAGRVDDPKSVRAPCKIQGAAQ